MKRQKEASTSTGAAAVDEYIAAVAEPARSTLQKIRATIRSVVPSESTEGISYGIPAFKYKGPLLGYAAFPDHCSLFVMDPSVMELFKEELTRFQTSKGTIRFPTDRPPTAAFLKKLTKARLSQNENRKRSG